MLEIMKKELMKKFEEVLHEIAKEFVKECIEEGIGTEELSLDEFILENRKQLLGTRRLLEAEGIIEAFELLVSGFNPQAIRLYKIRKV